MKRPSGYAIVLPVWDGSQLVLFFCRDHRPRHNSIALKRTTKAPCEICSAGLD